MKGRSGFTFCRFRARRVPGLFGYLLTVRGLLALGCVVYHNGIILVYWLFFTRMPSRLKLNK
jgi:hypothetical protein